MGAQQSLLSRLYDQISELHVERSQRAAGALDELHGRVLSGREKHPDAPHPDEQIRLHSRRLFERLRAERMVFSLPWHHVDTWLWAASCSDGVDWIEREIAYWEKHLATWHRRKKKILERLDAVRGLGQESEYVYEEGDEFLVV